MDFKGRFSRLFALAKNKLVTVEEMYVLGWGEGEETWKWRGGGGHWLERKNIWESVVTC